MTRMTEGERSAWIAALARRLRRLVRAVCRSDAAQAGPGPPRREPPDRPAKGGR